MLKLILTLLLIVGLIGMVNHKPGDGLTDQQKLTIFDHCNQHPDAWDC